MKNAVIDFSGRTFPHSHYVALSRVTSLDKLLIRNINETIIRVDQNVLQEQKRLRTEMQIGGHQADFLNIKHDTVTLLYHNVRSMNKDILDK
jgi:hypothetical protein